MEDFSHLAVWWLAAVLGAVVFMACFVPIMPTVRQKQGICIGPVAGAAVLVVFAIMKGRTLDTVLPMFVALMLAFPVGVIGHRGKMRDKLRDQEVNGQTPENAISYGVTVQVLVSLLIFGALTMIYVESL
ncbi:hypothetical protein [Streptomyces sp. NPDC051546]|uniref:hypothetical protein n=1 Tax=Streptomyces sp. NPDC051546 TaxID=3365655 RepID=UPI0037AF5444